MLLLLCFFFPIAWIPCFIPECYQTYQVHFPSCIVTLQCFDACTAENEAYDQLQRQMLHTTKYVDVMGQVPIYGPPGSAPPGVPVAMAYAY